MAAGITLRVPAAEPLHRQRRDGGCPRLRRWSKRVEHRPNLGIPVSSSLAVDQARSGDAVGGSSARPRHRTIHPVARVHRGESGGLTLVTPSVRPRWGSTAGLIWSVLDEEGHGGGTAGHAASGTARRCVGGGCRRCRRGRRHRCTPRLMPPRPLLMRSRAHGDAHPRVLQRRHRIDASAPGRGRAHRGRRHLVDRA